MRVNLAYRNNLTLHGGSETRQRISVAARRIAERVAIKRHCKSRGRRSLTVTAEKRKGTVLGRFLTVDDLKSSVQKMFDDAHSLVAQKVPDNRELWARCVKSANGKFQDQPTEFLTWLACEYYSRAGGKWE